MTGRIRGTRGISKDIAIIKNIANGCATIEKLLNAINAINNAGCDTHALGRGFDDLFRTAGEIGSSLVPYPANVYFEWLSGNESFFENWARNFADPLTRREQWKGIELEFPGGCP